MNLILDASVLVALLADAGPNGMWAEHVVEDRVLYAPSLLRAEVANSLRRLELGGLLSARDAGSAHAELLQLQIELLPFEPLADRIWALRRTVTSYDAWYVAAAEALDCPLATLDRRLARAPGPRCRFLTP